MTGQEYPDDVTVVVPTRNRPRATVNALRSVFAQSLQPKAIVVVDDASTDNTVAAVESEFGPNVKILKQAVRGGGNVARNAGADQADTTFISFLDSDDTFLPTKLEAQVSLMNKTGLGFSTTGWKTTTGRRYFLPHYSTRSLLRRNCLGGTSGLLVRRELFQKTRFDPKMQAVQDWELYLRLIQESEPAVISEPLYEYGLSEANRITKNARKRAIGHFQLYRTHIKDHPEVTPGIRRYHRIVQRVLIDESKNSQKRVSNWVKLRCGMLWS